MRNVLFNGVYVDKLNEYQKSELTLSDSTTFFACYDNIDFKGEPRIRIPRYYGKFKIDSDFTTLGESISIDNAFTPRNKEQEQAISTIVDNEHGIIAARVGFGKTFTAVAAICRLKVKALIIVPTEVLLNQWIDAIREYTKLENIGVIKGAMFFVDAPICVAMVQTLASRVNNEDIDFLEKMYVANFGITFYDECHTTASAPEFNKSTRAVFSKKIFGLSATAFRTDGLENFMKWHIGEILYDCTAFINDVVVGFYDIPMNLGGYAQYIDKGSSNCFNTRYAQYLAKSDSYIETIAKLVDLTITNGRSILVLSCRIDILTKIFDKCENKSDISVIHGSVKNKDYSTKAILSTVGCAKVGLDVDHIDTLLFATPLSSKIGLIQSIGRIADRKERGDRISLVVDITNSAYNKTESFKSLRLRNYASLNFKTTKVSGFEDYEKLIKLINSKEEQL